MNATASLLCLGALAAALPARASEKMYDMGPLLAEGDPLARSGPSVAQAGAGGSTPVRAVPHAWTFDYALGLELHHQDYTEPSLDVNEQGPFGGLTFDGRGSYGMFQFRGELRLAYGRMDYSSSGTGSFDGINDLVFEGRALAALAVPVGPSGIDRLTPYLGFGYRRLADYFGGKLTTTGAAGYDRISQYYYFPVGVEGLFGIADGWAVKPTIEYDHLIYGSQDSQLSQAVAGLSDLHNVQRDGFGLRASLMARTDWDGRPFEFGPFVRYWHIEQSNIEPVTFTGVTIGGGFEPDNHTVEAGLAMRVWF
jgi:hypothetical protein